MVFTFVDVNVVVVVDPLICSFPTLRYHDLHYTILLSHIVRSDSLMPTLRCTTLPVLIILFVTLLLLPVYPTIPDVSVAFTVIYVLPGVDYVVDYGLLLFVTLITIRFPYVVGRYGYGGNFTVYVVGYLVPSFLFC